VAHRQLLTDSERSRPAILVRAEREKERIMRFHPPLGGSVVVARSAIAEPPLPARPRCPRLATR
jgi:hypothetical protein